MTFWQAILLGLIQGLTEFLPVSSSGHLFLAEKYLQINDGSLSFEIALHLATLLAVVIFFWPYIKKLNSKKLAFLGLASLPLIPMVLLSKNIVDLATQSSLLIGLALLITALINYFSYKQLKKGEQEGSVDSGNKSIGIGLWQGLAIFPGISRSGMTLFGALKNKIKAEEAFSFAFLLSIPAILGASAYDLISSRGQFLMEVNYSVLMAGMLSAFVSGYVSLKILKNVLSHNRFLIFTIYCLLMGLSQIILAVV